MLVRVRHLAMLAALLTAGCGTAVSAVPESVHTPRAGKPSTRLSVAPAPARITYPARGQRKWITAAAQQGRPDGRAGRLLTYRVLIEKDIRGLDRTAFAGTVRATLRAPRGWTSGGRWRFRRVGAGGPADFIVYLATPRTRDVLCGVRGDGYTSCRHGDSVVLNVARWVKGVPAYEGRLSLYRQYMINHELGHRLGQGHMLCPGAGEPAPVMQQQTLGMHGCTPNPWPYPDRDDHFYTGRSGAYDDRAPAPDRGNS